MHLRAPRTTTVPALVLAAASVLALAPGAGIALAGTPGAQAPAAGPGAEPDRGGPAAVAEASAGRLELADKVAAAKYGTGKPIDDPGREREVLATVAERAAGAGVDPGWAAAVFRDQIEANKAVQRGLYARWEAHPEERPADRPDLGTEVRPELDRITTELLAGLEGTREARGSATCGARLAVGGARAAHVRHFDRLHAEALAAAVRSVC